MAIDEGFCLFPIEAIRNMAVGERWVCPDCGLAWEMVVREYTRGKGEALMTVHECGLQALDGDQWLPATMFTKYERD